MFCNVTVLGPATGFQRSKSQKANSVKLRHDAGGLGATVRQEPGHQEPPRDESPGAAEFWAPS
eukprot:7539521-Pyramimonas_sp.AAC.1